MNSAFFLNLYIGQKLRKLGSIQVLVHSCLFLLSEPSLLLIATARAITIAILIRLNSRDEPFHDMKPLSVHIVLLISRHGRGVEIARCGGAIILIIYVPFHI